MLAQLETPTNDFAALAAYLIHGRERPTSPDRVAWTFAQNMATDDPMLAATIMTATAEQSRRCRHACYHAMIAWATEERPSPEQMQAIARATLEMAGLGEHQALVMGHGDKAHPHLHMMINRVHPETGRAWSTSHDYRRFDRIMKQLSETHGFEYVPGHAFEPQLTDGAPKRPNSRARYAARKGAATNRPQWSRAAAREMGERLSVHLDAASTWDDLEALLATEGLTLEPKGQGYVAGTPASYVKLSALGLTRSAKSFLRHRLPTSRRTVRPQPPSRSPVSTRHLWTVDAIDIAKALGSREDVRHAVRDAVRERKGRLLSASLMVQLLAELREQWSASTSHKPAKPRSRPQPSPRRRPASRDR